MITCISLDMLLQELRGNHMRSHHVGHSGGDSHWRSHACHGSHGGHNHLRVLRHRWRGIFIMGVVVLAVILLIFLIANRGLAILLSLVDTAVSIIRLSAVNTAIYKWGN